MAICPFMSNWDDGVLRQQECMQADCALWDSVNNRCGAKVSDYTKQIVIVLHEGNDESKRSVGELLTQIKQSLHENSDENQTTFTDRIRGTYDHIVKILTPTIDNTNKHTKSIDYHITRIDERSAKATISYAAILAQEFIQGQDFDENGMIYGRDFKIKNPPPILKALEDDLEWREPDRVLTLEEYRNTLSEKIEDIVVWVYDEYQNLRT